jgi:hypothetical protein
MGIHILKLKRLKKRLRNPDGCPIRPLNPPILGDFEVELDRKSPRIGGLGGECKNL